MLRRWLLLFVLVLVDRARPGRSPSLLLLLLLPFVLALLLSLLFIDNAAVLIS